MLQSPLEIILLAKSPDHSESCELRYYISNIAHEFKEREGRTCSPKELYMKLLEIESIRLTSRDVWR